MPQLASASTECYMYTVQETYRTGVGAPTITDKRFWRAIDRQLKLALDPDVAAII